MSDNQKLLLIDADDTLWENNIYFERVIEEFIRLVNHQRYSCAEVRGILDDIERANLKVHGYGSEAFGRNLRDAYVRLSEKPCAEAELERVAALAASIARQEMEIIEGVPETLGYLATRHRLVLFTKGNEEEQRAKLERSGLAGFFAETRVVREKNAATYRDALHELEAHPAATWMIGNSPRSDVNPALAAGLNAVLVPHHATWNLEQEELTQSGSDGRLRVVSRFSELREIF